ncbi:MAG: glutamyl-tRNA amidotransferase [Ruminiclostridium sp.]|nr:glutamyl-tRNA amidotransferase [Ruminiclostridium sp.]
MSVIIPDCPNCKHFYNNADISKALSCKAFPDGIPNENLWGEINVKEIPECANGYKYEEINQPPT